MLLGRRHAGHKFMPGKFVFPGGRIEALDRDMSAASELHPDTQTKLLERVAEPSAELARGFALAAVREMAEETGLLLGVKRDRRAADAGRDLGRLRQGEDPSRPRANPFHRPRHHAAAPAARFDTRFFTADATAIAHKIEGVVGPDSELVELVWIPIEEATQLDMPTITGVVLEELAARVAAGMAHSLPVPFYFMQDQKFLRELL